MQRAKRFLFARKRHGPGVRGRAEDRNVKPSACFGVACSGASTDVSSAARENAGFRGMGAPTSELDNWPLLRGNDTPGRFRRNGRLEGKRRQQICFNKLRFN